MPAARFDRGVHWRAKIGYLLLATEQTVQDDIMALRPEGVGVHVTRLAIADLITVETLAAQADLLADASRLLLSDGSLDVVCYACTSGSLVVGEDRVFDELRRGQPQAVPTSIITGVIAALRAVQARRLVVCTPYVKSVNEAEIAYLEARGFTVEALYGLELEKDSDMVRLPPDFLAAYAAAASARHPDADAVFFSCGAMRSLGIVDTLERALGKPVIVSNQAMIWDCLRKAGIDDRLQGYGQLFSVA
ncbi:MAG: Asp/Glu racemase [Thalassobaculaceae bacterium]|nr:Asp/Glu racemase [Thalassobaculaceae bacterium]